MAAKAKTKNTGLIKFERLREVLDFDAETGVFAYKTRQARRVRIGDVAGSINGQGYRQINIDGKSYKAHRLAWLYVTCEWPRGLIDHINGDRSDNRIANLRLASRSQNLANSKIYRTGKNTRKGIRQVPDGKWIARIQKNNQPIFLGRFDDAEAASNAYRVAAENLFGDFARA